MTDINKAANELLASHDGKVLLNHLKGLQAPFTPSGTIMSGDWSMMFCRFIALGVLELTDTKVLGTSTYKIADKYNI